MRSVIVRGAIFCQSCCSAGWAKNWTVFESVVTLTLRKEYLNIVTYNIPVLLWIKTEQFGI